LQKGLKSKPKMKNFKKWKTLGSQNPFSKIEKETDTRKKQGHSRLKMTLK